MVEFLAVAGIGFSRALLFVGAFGYCFVFVDFCYEFVQRLHQVFDRRLMLAGLTLLGVVLEPAYQDWLIPSIRLLPYVMGVYGVAALLSVMYAYLTLVTVRMVMSGFRVVAGWIEFFKV